MSDNLRLTDVIGLVVGAVMFVSCLYGLLFVMSGGGTSFDVVRVIGDGIAGLYFFGRSIRNLCVHRT
jgi:hypothetical protein